MKSTSVRPLRTPNRTPRVTVKPRCDDCLAALTISGPGFNHDWICPLCWTRWPDAEEGAEGIPWKQWRPGGDTA